jgi:hypothetical protein
MEDCSKLVEQNKRLTETLISLAYHFKISELDAIKDYSLTTLLKVKELVKNYGTN